MEKGSSVSWGSLHSSLTSSPLTRGLSPHSTSMGVGHHDCLPSSLPFVPVANRHQQPLRLPVLISWERNKLHGLILSSLCSSPHDGWPIKETGGPLLVQLNRARKAGSLAQLPVEPLPQHSCWQRHILPWEGIQPERTVSYLQAECLAIIWKKMVCPPLSVKHLQF